MKKITNMIAVALIIFAMSFMAIAKGKNEKITFSRDMMVNGTLVKKGTYKVSVSDDSKELAIFEGKTTLVKTAIHMENRNRKPSSTEVIFTEKDNQNVLNSITFVGGPDTIVISEAGKETATPQ